MGNFLSEFFTQNYTPIVLLVGYKISNKNNIIENMPYCQLGIFSPFLVVSRYFLSDIFTEYSGRT